MVREGTEVEEVEGVGGAVEEEEDHNTEKEKGALSRRRLVCKTSLTPFQGVVSAT